jgi:predicted Ser/Thr protein kinase
VITTKSSGVREIDLEKVTMKKESKEARRAIRLIEREKKRQEDKLMMHLHPWAGQ